MGAGIGDRIRLARGDMTQAELGGKIGVHAKTIMRYEQGSPVPSDVLVQICDATGTRPDWILLGDRDVEPARYQPKKPPSANMPADQREIPILSTISAGHLTANGDADMPVGVGALGYIVAADPKDENAFALKVDGASMAPVLMPGDFVVVSPRRMEDLRYQMCVVKIRGEDVTLKYMKRRGDVIVLESENPAYRPIEVPIAEVEIMGRVVAWLRNFQE